MSNIFQKNRKVVLLGKQRALRGWSAEQRKPNLLRDSISQLQLHYGSPRKVTIFFFKSLTQEQICMRNFYIRSYQKFLRVAPQAPALARQMSGGHGGQRSERAPSFFHNNHLLANIQESLNILNLQVATRPGRRASSLPPSPSSSSGT